MSRADAWLSKTHTRRRQVAGERRCWHSSLCVDTHRRIYHLGLGSPYKSYVKLALSLALGLGRACVPTGWMPGCQARL